MECRDDAQKDRLRSFFGETLAPEMFCRFGCSNRHTHTREAHHCGACGERGHTSSMCGRIVFPREGYSGMLSATRNKQAFELLKNKPLGSVVHLPAGMGCSLFYKKVANAGAPMDTFFLHSDSHGQYGRETSDLPHLERFLGNPEGAYLCDVTKSYLSLAQSQEALPESTTSATKSIKCPICRTVGGRGEAAVKGLDESCNVCWENKVEVYLLKCGHVCLCETCWLNFPSEA